MLAALNAETNKQLDDEAQSRKKIVGEQREIEEQLAADKNGRAIFFVKFPLTPLYISPDAVQFNEQSKLYELKPNHPDAIPAGLIPEEKLKDPEQLSTVLGRVLTLKKLEENPVIIFYVKHRENVDRTQFEVFCKKRPNFILQQIDEAKDYTPFIGKISEATYAYRDKSEASIRQCIFATQIIDPNRPSAWQRFEGKKTQEPIADLNKLLLAYDKNPIDEMSASVSRAPARFFSPQSANQAAANPSSTASCPSSTCKSK